jgi:hypothetical protein
MNDAPPAAQPLVPGMPPLRLRDLPVMSTHDLIAYRDLSPYVGLEAVLSLLSPGDIAKGWPTIPPTSCLDSIHLLERSFRKRRADQERKWREMTLLERTKTRREIGCFGNRR